MEYSSPKEDCFVVGKNAKNTFSTHTTHNIQCSLLYVEKNKKKTAYIYDYDDIL